MKLSIISLAAALAMPALAFAAPPTTITVPMKALNHSGETGTATLTQLPGGVRITVNVKNAPAAAQPTHIYPGTYTKLNPAPEFPLRARDHGKSVTMLSGKKLSDLSGGKYSINVHKSSNDLKTYVSCGEIK